MSCLFAVVTLGLGGILGWLAANSSIDVVLSFLLLLPVLVVLCFVALRSDDAKPAFSTVAIFSILFLFVAPILQLVNDQVYFVNTMPFRIEDVWFANSMTTLFCVVFAIGYVVQRPSSAGGLFQVNQQNVRTTTNCICVLAIFVGLWGFSGLDAGLIISDEANLNDGIGNLLKHKTIFMLPFLALSLKLLEMPSRYKFTILVVLIAAVLATKNPLYDRRNALGPVYISILLFVFPSLLKSSRRYFGWLLGVMVIGFPAASVLTHLGAGIIGGVDPFEDGVLIVFLGHFSDLHYDAWSSLIAARELVHENGYMYGSQLLGSILFFVPRVVWPSKPISSGYEVGDHLMTYHFMWFNNLSSTLPAEGYLDFGVFGVVLFAIALAIICRRIDSKSRSENSFETVAAVYFSLYLMFVLRGALLPAVAYGVGAYACLKVLPYFISTVLSICRAAVKKVPE